MLDDWHPEVIFTADQHECRIYSDDRCSEWVVLDEVDYWWAVQWCWNIVEPIPDGRRGHSRYFRRTARDQDGRDYSVYLHVAIQQRKGVISSFDAPLVDHLDGDTFNCRRENLRWASHEMNRRNVYGRYVYGELVVGAE